ncbi:MAG: hypothetical protein JWO78_1469 [Micavibrio sp.]|nr:hypothetical protein [Micavibrio sp.]
MEKDARYFVVGIFVSLCLAGLLSFVIWMAGAHDNKDYLRYTVYFTDSVSGLKEGANVSYKGVDVGKVTDIRLAHERKDLIKVDIEVANTTPVRAKTNASLAVLGVTGLVFMDLTTAADDTQPVPRVQGEAHPVLQGNGTQLAKLFQDIPAITQQVLEMAKKINKLMDDKNMGSLDATLDNVQQMTHSINALLSTENVANVSTTLDNFSRSSDDLKEMVQRFQKTADEIDKTVSTINRVVTKNEDNVNRFGQDGLNQITTMTREAQKTAQSIRRAADKLNQDPSQILYKPSNKGVEIAK